MEKQQNVLQGIINFIKKNSFKIVVILVLLTFVAAFIYALGFMIEPFVTSKESGYKLLIRNNTSATEYAKYGIDIQTHTSNYYDFYMPANDVNRFLLTSSIILLVAMLALKITGSVRRIKFYLSNFVTCAIVGVLGIVFSIVNITSLTSLSNKWEKNVEKGVVDTVYEILQENPDYEPNYDDYTGNTPGYFNDEGTRLNVKVIDPVTGLVVKVNNGPRLVDMTYGYKYTSVLHTMSEKEKNKAIAEIKSGNFDYEVDADYIFNIGYVVFTCVIVTSSLLLVLTTVKGIKQIGQNAHKRMGAELDE